MPQKYRVTAPFKGLRTDRHESLIGPKDASDTLNLNFDRGGVLQKRPGKALYDTMTAECLGMVEYRDQSMLVSKQGQDFYSLKATASLIGSGGEGALGVRMQARVHNGRLYIADGSQPPHVYDGTNLVDVGISAPAAGPSCAAGAALVGRKGVYDYVYSYYSSTWGAESPRSPASAVIDVDETAVDLTLVESVDVRVDKIRVYRRKTNIRESKWRLVEEVASSTSYTDDSQDVDVSTDIYSPDPEYTIPAFTMLETHKRRIFWSGDASQPGRLYQSEIDSPETITRWALALGDDAIKGLASFKGRLFIFKAHQVIVASGEDLEAMSFAKISDTGAFGPSAICLSDDRLYWAGPEGIFYTTLVDVVEVSGAIKPTFEDRLAEGEPHCFLFWDPINSAVWYSYEVEGGDLHEAVLLFYPKNIPEAGHSWLKWDLSVSAACYDSAGVTPDAVLEEVGHPHIEMGDEQNYLFAVGGTTDNGEAIAAHWTTGAIDAPEPALMKNWLLSEAVLARTSEDDTVQTSYYLEGNGTKYAAQATVASARSVARARIQRRSRSIKMRFDL